MMNNAVELFSYDMVNFSSRLETNYPKATSKKKWKIKPVIWKK